MTSQQITLTQFFSPQKQLSAEQLPAIESGKEMSALKERLLKEARIKWPIAVDAIVGKIGEALNISIPDIMIAAWNKYKILLQYTDKEKYPPTETFLVPLAEHTIKSEHQPYIEVLIHGEPVTRIEFDIEMLLTLEGIVLKIQDGRIKEVFTGNCKGKGSIKYENKVILEKQTASIPFPGSINLGDGVLIPNV